MRSRFWKAGNDEGSVALTMFVVMIATLLVVQVLYLTYGGLRYSRRAGDSANALQVADAGVNDAVKAINAITAANPDAVQFTGEAEVGPAGSYEYSAVKTDDVWRIEGVGTDPTGVQRRILADAVDMPLFGNAFFGLNFAQLKGTADSYLNPTLWCLTGSSTPQAAGTVGSAGSITLEQNQGQGQSGINCRGEDSSWDRATDGCIFYEQDAIPNDVYGNSPIRAAACPPLQDPLDPSTHPGTYATQASFHAQGKAPTAGAQTLGGGGDWTCKNGDKIPRGAWKVNGNLTLEGGCRVTAPGTDPAGDVPAELHVYGTVRIGAHQGQCDSGNKDNVVNKPYVAEGCSPGNLAKSWWAEGWAAQLQIYVMGAGDVTFGQHAYFWGVIYAPQSAMKSAGGGTPQIEIWGAVVASSAYGSAQFRFHYDVTLASAVRTTQYVVRNWREEPLQSSGPVEP